MSAIYKLVVGDRIEWDVKFTLNDAGAEKHFGMRLSARRQERGEQERELGEQIKVLEFLAARGVSMVSWIGKAPLQDAEGAPVPAGPEALDALYQLVGGMVSLVFAGYLRANGAQGAAGN
jgi:hypothetical protein